MGAVLRPSVIFQERPLSPKTFRLTAIFLLLGAFVLLAACQSTASDEAQSVTFMVSGDPAELAAYEALVDSFHAATDNIEVSITYVASGKDFREKLATMFSGGIPPDVFLYNYRRLGDFAAAAAVHPIDDLLDASTVLNREDFYPITLNAFTYQGALQCLPQNLSSPVIYYNQALFDAAGLAYPAAGWTRADFLAAARALTRDLDGDGVTDQWGFGTEIETIRLAPFLWQNGGDFLDDPANPTALTLDTPEARAAIQWFVDLQMVEHVTPDLVAETTQSSEDRFLNGTVAMFMNSRVAVPALRTITAFAWDAAPLPDDGTPASVLHSDAFCMSAKAAEDAAHLAAAWTFIEYSLSETGQTLLAETGRTVPSMIRVAESQAYLGSTLPDNGQAWLDAADHMRALPMIPGWNTFEELFTKELQRAFYGDITVDELITGADEIAAPLFAP